MIRYSEYLPRYLKGTRWEQIIDTTQTLVEDFFNEKVNRIKDRYDYKKANIEEKKDTVYKQGYDLPSYDGYTETENYIDKQSQNLIKQIKNKTTAKSYDYMYYVFNLVGKVYPLRFTNGFLRPAKNIGATFETPDRDILFFDQDLPFIQFYINNDITQPFPDNPPIETGLPTLLFDSADEEDPLVQALNFDGNNQVEYSSHFILSYNNKLAETPTSFITNETARAIYESVIQIKKMREVPHFQYSLAFKFNSYNVIPNPREEQYITSDMKSTASVFSIIVSPEDSLINVTKVQFGIGEHTVLNNTITGVKVPSTEIISVSKFDLISQNDDSLIWEDVLEEYGKFTIDNELFQSTISGIGRPVDPIENPSSNIIRFNLQNSANLAGVSIGSKFQVSGATNPNTNRRYIITNLDNTPGQKFVEALYYQNDIPVQEIDGELITLNFFVSNNFYFFREMALLKEDNTIIAYVKFPDINFDSRMYSSVNLHMEVIR